MLNLSAGLWLGLRLPAHVENWAGWRLQEFLEVINSTFPNFNGQNKELIRNRISTPKDYIGTIKSIISIIKDIEDKYKENLNVGICHPGATDKTTGLIKNAHNSQWLNNKNLVKDIKKNINNNIY